VLLIAVAPLLLAVAGGTTAKRVVSAELVTPRDLVSGERLFQTSCAPCHGPKGQGGQGPPLAVSRLARAADRESLAKLISNGIEGTEMPAARLEHKELRQVTAWVMKLGKHPVEKVAGTPENGERLYFGKGGCIACHTIGGRGGAVGPDLTDIGLRRGASHLRASLLRPEEAVPRSSSPYRADVSIAQNFLQVVAVTKGGEEIRGVRVNEDTFSIQLRDGANRLYSFFKAELAELRKEWGRTPMPSYEAAFSPQELDDLVAFMASLRGDLK
jgi:cytochrome c oxidase cbb3-type subunit 3